MIYKKKKKIVSFLSSNQREKKMCYVTCYSPINLSESSTEVFNRDMFVLPPINA